jgi:hypothetical protein
LIAAGGILFARKHSENGRFLWLTVHVDSERLAVGNVGLSWYFDVFSRFLLPDFPTWCEKVNQKQYKSRPKADPEYLGNAG